MAFPGYVPALERGTEGVLFFSEHRNSFCRPDGTQASGCYYPGNELPGYFRVSPWDRYGVDFQAPPSAVMKNKYAPGIFVSLNISNSSQGAVIRVQEAESGCGFINSVWRSMNP